MNRLSRLWEVSKTLVDTALGRVKADLVITNGVLVNVYTGELIDEVNVAVKGDRIAHVGDKIDHLIGPETTVVDAKGHYLAPGFLDGHVHIESSMLLPTEFARAVLPHGTTAVFADPHEIANVLGVRGIRLILENSENIPLKVYIAIPSCVPASLPEFETSGASIGPEDVEACLDWDRVVGLAEVMNYPGVLMGDSKMHGEIEVTLRKGKVVEGHYASPELDEKISAYIAAGITSCHESVRRVDALERVRRGIWAMIREGSAWRDLHEVIKAVTEYRIDSRRISLVSDDRHVDDIIDEGHMDHIVKRAVEEGVDPVKAIQMATINTAEHYNVDLDLGGIAPGKYADILIIEDLSRIDIKKVFSCGILVAEDGRLRIDIPKRDIPKWALETMNVARRLEPEDFTIRVSVREGRVRANVIEVIEAMVTTRHIIMEVDVRDYKVESDIERDIIKVAVLERHHGTGNMGKGLVTGFGIEGGAVASSVAHDSHNLIVMGADDRDMAYAANKLIDIGGGMIIVRDGEVLGLVELPVAGLMSTEDAENVSMKVEGLSDAWREIGRDMISPFMTMSLLPLSVLPEIRVTDKGLIDTINFKKIPLIIPEH